MKPDEFMRRLRPQLLDPNKHREQLIELVRRPAGAMAFHIDPNALDSTHEGSIPGFPLITGPMFYDLRMLRDLKVQWLVSTPGAGTREATVSIMSLSSAPILRVILNWSPKEISISIGEPGDKETWVEAHGIQSETGIRVTKDGQIVTLGGPGVLVRDAIVYMSGEPVLRPTAIEAWESTLEAIEIIQGASSDQGFLFEIVTGNLCLAMLVTGYEAYCKTRFLELDAEGVEPDFDACATVFLRKDEIQNGRIVELRDQAAANKQSPVEYVVKKRLIDFQDYARCRRAYAKTYGLSFGGAVGIRNTVLEALQTALKYRHQIVHVSATTTILNHADLPGPEPVMAKKDFVLKTVSEFKEFVEKLHTASLELNAPHH